LLENLPEPMLRRCNRSRRIRVRKECGVRSDW
jgi:hypothetical protein